MRQHNSNSIEVSGKYCARNIRKKIMFIENGNKNEYLYLTSEKTFEICRESDEKEGFGNGGTHIA